ncbi:flagellar hook protein FlgE [Desulfosalsimonas propionicica]|uniref:Flagellar hook protein FlgE n=1 Tax=Desulfosalsimonas propionicica TaxID=332175 RepID=A0A7W0C8Z8_9BACT|nr:flagellar hook protein FlgE [Desulfosalsimonas propionicica]MBA2881305.1 flagellar hook protein FlgE [Desulfosalsimonas propionicica]
MSLGGAMNSGISGLRSFSSAMGVIGNNLANSNTAGFKASRTLFADLIPDTVSGSGGTSQVGRGSGLSTVDDIFTQGSIESTSSSLDLAIEGTGFFMVRNPDAQASSFTRSGAFRLNEEGYMVNPENYVVQGYDHIGGGEFQDLAGDIQINTRSSVPGEASSMVELTTNLNANTDTNKAATPGQAAIGITGGQAGSVDGVDIIINGTGLVDGDFDFSSVGAGWGDVTDADELATVLNTASNLSASYDNVTETLTLTTEAGDTLDTGSGFLEDGGTAVGNLISHYDGDGWDINNPVASSDFATTSEVYDTLGNTHLITTYFSKTDLNQWEYNQVVAGSELDMAAGIFTAEDISLDSEGEIDQVRVGTGNVGFDDSGLLNTINGQTQQDMGSAWPEVSIAEDKLVWDNGSSQGDPLGYSMNLTQFATESRVVTQQSDGYSSGYLNDISVDNEGIITGTYSNGESRSLARLALGKFANENGLEKLGNNLYSPTRDSGPADIGTPGAGFGRIFSNSLEQSTVDIAEEFTRMITTQRSFQANSKTITTTDEMLSEVINIKR